MPALPSYITSEEGGHGFAQIAKRLLETTR
jgi:hypothetical protein